MSFSHIATSALALYFLTFNVLAGDTIYRWVDKKGVPHYSHVKPSDSSINDVEEIILRNNASSKANKKSAPQKKTASGNNDYQQIAQKNCDSAQQNAKILSAYKNVTQQDSDGNVTQLSAADRKEQLELANKQIEIFCQE